jgi:hypothetical protein
MKRIALLFLVAFIVGFLAVPAGAGPNKAETWTARDFYTGALDANGDFKLVYCYFAKLTLIDGKANETYKCQFLEDSGAVLPDHAMQWDYESSYAISGPWRWYSDVEAINNIDGKPDCFMYTQPMGEDPGESSWSEVLTPSGRVNVTVKYRPPVFEIPNGTPCE